MSAEIEVNGFYETFSQADQWDLNLSVSIRKSSQKEATEVFKSLKPSLDKIIEGNSECEKIQTNFSSMPWYDWSSAGQTLKGWEITNSYTLRYRKQEVGTENLRALSQLKYVQIQSVSPSLQKETQKKLRQKVLSLAFEEAYSKAEVLAKAMGSKIHQIKLVTENNGGSQVLLGARGDMLNAENKASTADAQGYFSLEPVKVSLSQTLVLRVDVR